MNTEHPDYYAPDTSHVWNWAAKNYLMVDEYFKCIIDNEIIRETFILGLAYGYNENDPLISAQVGDSGFDDVTYAYIMQNEEELIDLYMRSDI